MGESTCLMQTFSHPSDTFHEAKEGNPIHALGESISFGRFMSESLAWEKWSSFNQNRYLEEVEKYSKPGSVAQKKAYFEAHYKKIAEQKAAKLLEQENLAAINAPKPETDNEFYSGGTLDTELVGSDCHVDTNEPEVVVSIFEAGSFEAKGCTSSRESCGVESTMVQVDLVMENQVLPENSMQIVSPNQHEHVQNKMVAELEISTTTPPEKLPLKEISSSNQESLNSTTKTKRSASSSKAPVCGRSSKLPFSPAIPRTPVNPRKENNSTPNSKKTVKDSADKRRTTPKSLHMSIHFAPSPSHASETSKIATPIIQKTRDSRGSVLSTKMPNDCSSPLSTQARFHVELQASGNGVPKLPPVTPHPESRRTKAPHEHTAHGSRKMDVKCKSLSVDCSKSSSPFGNKTWSPSVSSSFSLRSEERAAKRKEYFQKLEEKFNAEEAQRMQLQKKSKEKAETELRKLRQTLGFKAKPMPDFYRETPLPQNQLKKIPLTRPRSPKLGRKPNPSAPQDTSSMPPRRPSVKTDCSKHAMDKTSRTPTRSVTSTSKKNAHENASPNIQRL